MNTTKKGTFKLEKFSTGLHCIVLDDLTVSSFVSSEQKRLVCKLNAVIDFHCALLKNRKGEHYITIGSTICKKLKLKVGDFVNAEFFPDTEKYQFVMPIELEEVLISDKAASAKFDALTAGNQRSLMYLVGQVKTVEKRIERALKIANRLKRGINNPKVILK